MSNGMDAVVILFQSYILKTFDYNSAPSMALNSSEVDYT